MNRFAARELATFSPDLSNGAVRLYLALDEYARDSGSCWPKQKTLAGRLGCSVRQLKRYLQELVAAGMCLCERATPGGANRYRLVYVRNHTTPMSPGGDTHVPRVGTPMSPHIRNKQDIETERTYDRESFRQALREYPRAGALPGLPDDAICDQVAALTGGDFERLAVILRAMHADYAAPAQNWAWFPAVIRRYAEGKALRRA